MLRRALTVVLLLCVCGAVASLCALQGGNSFGAAGYGAVAAAAGQHSADRTHNYQQQVRTDTHTHTHTHKAHTQSTHTQMVAHTSSLTPAYASIKHRYS
jgi:hypothetical protein